MGLILCLNKKPGIIRWQFPSRVGFSPLPQHLAHLQALAWCQEMSFHQSNEPRGLSELTAPPQERTEMVRTLQAQGRRCLLLLHPT